jgi:hypothetical protein
MTSPEGYEAYARILFVFVGPSTRVGTATGLTWGVCPAHRLPAMTAE